MGGLTRMELIQEIQDNAEYLKSSDIIDYENEEIKKMAINLAKGIDNEIELAKRVYEYVRDNILHSSDIKGKIVACSASEVLRFKQGICFAKSHLLAAFLRCLKVPVGFCYQKLLSDNKSPNSFVLHGLNAIYLKNLRKWIRIDARGGKKGKEAEFSIKRESLAFRINESLGEIDYPVIYLEPNGKIIKAFKSSKNLEELINKLPSKL